MGKFQLVLQFRGDTVADLDDLIIIERAVSRLVEDNSDDEVDGHDIGSGERNIFIITDDPQGAFKKCVDWLENRGLLLKMRAAYRDLDEEDFTNVWPLGSKEAFSVS